MERERAYPSRKQSKIQRGPTSEGRSAETHPHKQKKNLRQEPESVSTLSPDSATTVRAIPGNMRLIPGGVLPHRC